MKFFKQVEIYFSLNNKMGTSSPLHSKLRIFTLVFKKEMVKPNKHENGLCIVIRLCLIRLLFFCLQLNILHSPQKLSKITAPYNALTHTRVSVANFVNRFDPPAPLRDQ